MFRALPVGLCSRWPSCGVLTLCMFIVGCKTDGRKTMTKELLLTEQEQPDSSSTMAAWRRQAAPLMHSAGNQK